MKKLAYRKAFGDAYEYVMEKVAGCCGGRGGQTMVLKHGGAPNEDYGIQPGITSRTFSNAKLNRNVDDAYRIGGRGKDGYTVKFYDKDAEKKYRKLLADHGLKSAPDMDTYRKFWSQL